MRIENVCESADKITVETTGAVFQFSEHDIVVTAKIPNEQKLAKLFIDGLGAWRLESKGESEAVLSREGQKVVLGSDSFLAMTSKAASTIKTEVLFDAERIEKHGQACDLRGGGFGLGIYRQNHDRQWNHKSFLVSDDSPCFFHGFPPRRAERFKGGQRIAHEGRPNKKGAYPRDSLIREVAQHADIFALHAYFWHEADPTLRPRWSRYRFRKCPWYSPEHRPQDESELTRVMATVHDAGMRFLPYVSPRYSTAPDMLAELARLMARYSFDGFYLDGLRGDFVEQRELIRSLRQMLGDEKVIYLNGSDQPFGTPRLTAPFIDAHCNFVLRGDSGRGGLGRDQFLYQCVSGLGGGNQTGVWCHYGSSGWPIPFDRVPSEADQRAAQAAGVQIWRRSFWWPGKRALARFDRLNRQAFHRKTEDLRIREWRQDASSTHRNVWERNALCRDGHARLWRSYS